ncbi:putative ribonuclease H protein [Ananas comosus]|uniref:Putative ribonuclease H protein n=1 Tax=Ananas comosus TaxID=4615 RepID=A0A199VBB0_ANACO|nr:putative ribonuclease H protein [Ananas comosus]
MRNLLLIWKLFEWASGLKINMNKTELIYLCHNASRATRLADILGCRVGKLPFRYLGMTLHTKSLRKEDWAPLVNRIEARIEGWKAKLLSYGGRSVLINSVLSNLPLFYFAIFKAPKWVLNRIETLRRAFFWKVKSLYDFITDGGQRDPMYSQLWRIRMPAKNKIFTWILLRKRLLTADRLNRRGCAVN